MKKTVSWVGSLLPVLLTTEMGVSYLLPRLKKVITHYQKVKNQFIDTHFKEEINLQ